MAYEATQVAVSKSQEQLRKLIMGHKGFAFAAVCERANGMGDTINQEGFHAQVIIDAGKEVKMSRPYEEMKELRATQIYAGEPYCERFPACSSRAKIMWQNPDHEAIDLCLACSEQAFSQGRISDRYPIDNYSQLLRFDLIPAERFHLLPEKIRQEEERKKRMATR